MGSATHMATWRSTRPCNVRALTASPITTSACRRSRTCTKKEGKEKEKEIGRASETAVRISCIHT